ncbi:MAG: GntR family transcriptional regulator [Anaerovoracaceae bacterium]
MFNINMQEHKPLRELVYEELRMLIMTGQIKPGVRMMEIDLADSMGVSRTPVREAIRQLEKDNLVTIEPRKGAYVSDISPYDLNEMLVVREPLEGLAIQLAADRMSTDDVDVIRGVNFDYEEALQSGDTEKLIQLDTQFHSLITKGSGNPYLIELCQQVQERVLRFRYVYFKSIKRAEDIIEEHNAILEMLQKRDGKGARKCMESHILNLRESIQRDSDFQSDK